MSRAAGEMLMGQIAPRLFGDPEVRLPGSSRGCGGTGPGRDRHDRPDALQRGTGQDEGHGRQNRVLRDPSHEALPAQRLPEAR
jgi:hypothetical protein